MSGVYVDQQLNRQQVDDGIGHANPAQQHAEEIEHTGKEHRQVRRHGFGVDDSRYRVCGVMKAVDELKRENKG
ncbi:hypothetical protein PS685_01785 [Pseudomonas fluorescens]|uniref:Uncharacterized protein n=1 Tax=Pseudomonas fluorescens TaxID=294 RepID=A0A5E6YM91_PSEFL|nr:hypothetical protein PS685_01785 [Pseudomonas fluorescens]